ncbi:MAG: hypothetical protein LAP85_12210 [Acidobacteriia bacterium]|nr:hypothetical protein [Terriglobia bacterium]
MSTTSLSKRELRQRTAELRALMCEWDPIGVMDDPGWPRDEYDCLVGPVLTKLQAGASTSNIADYLRDEVRDHFGLSPKHYDFLAVASRVQSWFNRNWRDLAEPVTIFGALLNEGVDVWRPVQARPLGPGVFRIVGVDADVTDETWQFPAGAIHRCEPKQLSDGTVQMTAVELVEAAG